MGLGWCCASELLYVNNNNTFNLQAPFWTLKVTVHRLKKVTQAMITKSGQNYTVQMKSQGKGKFEKVGFEFGFKVWG